MHAGKTSQKARSPLKTGSGRWEEGDTLTSNIVANSYLVTVSSAFNECFPQKRDKTITLIPAKTSRCHAAVRVAMTLL